jgi:hypothetical protein
MAVKAKKRQFAAILSDISFDNIIRRDHELQQSKKCIS